MTDRVQFFPESPKVEAMAPAPKAGMSSKLAMGESSSTLVEAPGFQL